MSDSFTEKYEQLKAEGYGDEEDRDEYMAENIFWVPKDARWEVLSAHADLRFFRPQILLTGILRRMQKYIIITSVYYHSNSELR